MTTFTATKPLPQQVPAFPRDRAVLADVLARVRADFPSVDGLTHVAPDAAVFQIVGDPTRYCLAITADEASALGYIR
jgi:hypothetical protein